MKILGKLHVNSSTSRNNRVVLHCTPAAIQSGYWCLGFKAFCQFIDFFKSHDWLINQYLTIMMASWRDLSVSSMNCSAPPRRMIVQD